MPTKAKLVGGAVAATFPANLIQRQCAQKLSIDGTLVTANLATSYVTPAAMAADMQTTINNSLPSRQVTVAYNSVSGKFESPLAKQTATPPKWRYFLWHFHFVSSFGEATVGLTASGTALAGKLAVLLHWPTMTA